LLVGFLNSYKVGGRLRRLAAIVFTDIAGYTALSAQDEEMALSLLDHQRELLQPIVRKYGGDWLKEIGDGILLSFHSTKEAVNCAIEIQQITRDIEYLNLRIGIHEGDIIEKDGDVFGDDVNIASRLEPFAAIGGIALSDKVQRSISSSPEFTTKYIGQPRLKGVKQEVKVYCITSHELPETKLTAVSAKLERNRIARLKWITPVLVVFGLTLYFLLPGGREVPSVGILLMENLGGEDDEFWARGITEDLIIHVARGGVIRVAPMQEAININPGDIPLPKIGRKLRVKYVLTSSIYKQEDEFDLRCQLIEAVTGNSVYARKWSESVESASAIVGTLADDILGQLGVSSKPSSSRATLTSPEAYELYLKGKYHWDKRQDKEDIEVARGMLEMSLELDPGLIMAKLKLGKSYRETGDLEKALTMFHECLSESKTRGDIISESASLSCIGDIHLLKGEYDLALEQYDQALVKARLLGAKSTEQANLTNLGSTYYSKDEIEPAIKYYKKSLQIALELGDERGEGEILHNMGSIYLEAGNYDEALEFFDQALSIFHDLEATSLESYTRICLGLIYYAKSNYETALSYLLKALELAENIDEKRGEVYALFNIGDVYNRTAEYETAEQYYQKALAVAQSIHDSYIEGISLTRLGELMVKSENYAESIQHFQTGCDIWRNLNLASYDVWTQSWWALAEYKDGNIKEALERATRIDTILSKTDAYEEYEIITDWNLYQLFAGAGEQTKAEAYLKLAYEEIMDHSERFDSQAEKSAFLNTIAENRDVIAAYQQLDNSSE
jgi:class 3 adenylate cyclase/tetratricopeptide (TPR) repeat protein